MKVFSYYILPYKLSSLVESEETTEESKQTLQLQGFPWKVEWRGGNASEKSSSVGLYPSIWIVESSFKVDLNSLSQTIVGLKEIILCIIITKSNSL